MAKLSSEAQGIREHWKEFRPKAYRALVKSGNADQFFQNQYDRAAQLEEKLYKHGLNSLEVHELLRDEFYPPSEDDQPELGGPFSWEQED